MRVERRYVICAPANGKLRKNILKYVEHADDLKNQRWGKLAMDSLVDGIRSYHNYKGVKKNVGGSLVFLEEITSEDGILEIKMTNGKYDDNVTFAHLRIANCEVLMGKKEMKSVGYHHIYLKLSESILRSVISGASSQQIECVSELILKKGCYIGGIQCDNDTSPGENSSSLSSLVSDFLTNAIHEIGDEDLVGREPVILTS
ncbi:hypothetical protein Tco_0255445, partial [Tanacetum coccineum]